MRDPYLYDDIDVLRNLGNIRDAEKLRCAEGDITKYTLTMVYAHRFNKFNTETLREIHRIIFDSLFDWAGEFRTIPVIKHEEILGGDTVRYTHPNRIKKELDEASKEISKLKKNDPKQDLLFKIVRIAANIWRTHPFREGNTRTIISFAVLLAAHLRIKFDYSLFEKHAVYVRNALVWASQGIYSKYEYLERIFYDAAGVDIDGVNSGIVTPKDYTHIEGYYVADYKEQPHKYSD
jgi:cell filamentation protein